LFLGLRNQSITAIAFFFAFHGDGTIWGPNFTTTASNMAPLWWGNSDVMPLSKTYLTAQNSTHLYIKLGQFSGFIKQLVFKWLSCLHIILFIDTVEFH